MWDSVEKITLSIIVSIKEKHQTLIADNDTQTCRRYKYDRRNPTLKGFLIGCLKSQRRNQRRENCPSYYQTDWYDLKLFVMALALLLLSITDAAMTMTLINNGAVEVNPFMDFLLNQSTNTFVYTKIILTSVCIIILVAHYHSKLFNTFRVDRILIFALSVYSALITYEVILYINYNI